MPTFGNETTTRIVYLAAALLLLYLGYRVGKLFAGLRAAREIARREQDLLTSQKGFKTLYENEAAALKADNEKLRKQIETLTQRVEDYRKKAAGLGGLFSSNNKRTDAMYALLLENEALEEQLLRQNEKLRDERGDSVKEQLRNNSYRRVLMSQLMSDERIKGYVAEVLADDKRLPAAESAGAGGEAEAARTKAEATAAPREG